MLIGSKENGIKSYIQLMMLQSNLGMMNLVDPLILTSLSASNVLHIFSEFCSNIKVANMP
jgi:hypothetical protein